jgi:transcriptional regulator with XRE-family HTH domain
MSIGSKIRKLRILQRMSQEELAYQLNVAQTSISNFESNKTIPDFLVMQKVCEVFKVSFEYFIEENTTNNNNNIEKAENCNIGFNTGIVNTIPEDIIENMLKRIISLENTLSKK